jgi:predicted nucleotidyltransferase
MTELELLANEIGANERTLRRALSEGTLRGERPTPRKLEIGAAEKRYLRRSWKLLAGLRGALRTEQNVRFALLFGSAARGEDSAASDLDLLVEMRDPSLARIADLDAKLEALLSRRVDVLTLEEAMANTQLLAQALNEGRVIVDREGRWPGLRDEAGALRRRAREGSRRAKRRALEGIDRMLAGRHADGQ